MRPQATDDVSDERSQPSGHALPGYALRMRNNRWRLVVDLPSMSDAAAVVERIAKGTESVTVSIETYDPVKGAYEHKGAMTFGGGAARPARVVLRRIGREARRFSRTARLALVALIAPILGLAALGAYGLAVPAHRPSSLAAIESAPPPSRILPREWTEAIERPDIPAAFHGEWAGDCAAARINGTGTMAVAAGSLFGQPVNWVRVIGSRILVNTGPDGASVSTRIRSDGLVLHLEERFTETVERRAERATFSPERPAVLSKCL